MADVLIIGGGIVGLLSALSHTDRGRRVTLVDAPASHPPASWAGGGILAPLFAWRYPDAMNRLTADGPARYRELVSRLAGYAGLRHDDLCDSGLWVEATGAERESALDWARDWRQRCEPRALAAAWPAAEDRDGVWFPEVGNIRNPRLLKALRARLADQGVRRVEDRAVAVEPEGRGATVVLAGGERLAAPSVLISAGAWSPSLLAPLGVSVPLFPAKGEMLLYRLAPGQVPSIVLTENGYLIPRADGAVLAGSTLKEGDASTEPTEEGRRRLEAMAASILPALADLPPEHHWAGVRPGCGRDWPYLGEVPGTHGVFAAVGHHRNGLVSAPASAEFLVQLMNGETPFLDPADYSLGPSSS
ncbi:NAD(P)/FAD-dependent oxidoreductase [Alloalcanivorax marinus]|uniref:NAD(P)/FAD-dependent oxidoreductase n=1 Tax=Alloalcanivorax marinus TaxID=1177169 RepID=UPI001932779D|nr:FAD-dependent oxidoreductase [Alloalcanivorax marinus]MBL7252271.1 FAD-dependent oxidoreductase [Alloalcanivorax marinus]